MISILKFIPIINASSTVITTSGNNFSYDGLIKGDTESLGFDVGNSYDIEVLVKDELSEVTFTDTFGSGIPNLALHKNGVGIMGKYDVDEGGPFQIEGRKILRSDILYENTSGTLDNITLSNTSENYDYIEIFGYDNDNHQIYSKIAKPNGKTINLTSSKRFENMIYTKVQPITFNGNSLIRTAQAQCGVGSDGYTRFSTNSADVSFYITKIIGWK